MLLPRENPDLFGHQKPFDQMKALANQSQLPHALMVSGKEGIGKTTFVFHVIKHALKLDQDAQKTQSLEQKIAAGSHPNILMITPSFDEKKQQYKSILTVNEIHKITPFFRQTSVDNAWRFVVVDKSHTMNRNAQNAILKILEEPPERSTIFLICENTGGFLPTIRSRCQLLRLDTLSQKHIIDELEDKFLDLTQQEIDRYAQLSEGSLGNAYKLIDMNALAIDEDFRNVLDDMNKGREVSLLKFCEEYGHSSKDQEFFFIQNLLKQLIQQSIDQKIYSVDRDDLRELELIISDKTVAQLIEIYDKVTAVFATGQESFLDRKLVLLHALRAMI